MSAVTKLHFANQETSIHLNVNV